MALENYIMLREIGKGCFSQVYAAVHKPSGWLVAVKVVDKQKADENMLRLEVEAMRQVGAHPNIVQLYDVLEDEKNKYLVLEHCDGGSLHDFLVSRGPVPESLARKWFVQLASAVAHAHSRHVINRDIKNANIFLDAQLNVKLGDFGLAITTPTDPHTFSLDTATGSPVFAAPEVYSIFEGKTYYGPQAEMWALGCVLHSCLSQALPFQVENYHEVWANYTPSAYASASCQDLLRSLMHIDVSQRLTMHDMWYHPWVTAENGLVWQPHGGRVNVNVPTCHVQNEASVPQNMMALANVSHTTDSYVAHTVVTLVA